MRRARVGKVVAGLRADGGWRRRRARAALLDARAIARRVGSPGMEAMAVQGLAHVAAAAGEVSEVLPLVDEAAALAMRPGVAPVHAGYVYCAVISICRALCDWGRATEWTKVSTRYCERESIAGYTGLCRFHQGEIDRLHGQLAEAEQRVLQACEELLKINRYSAGWGYSELVEIRVRRGDLDGAEEALAEAIALGDDGRRGGVACCWRRGMPGRRCGASAAHSRTPASSLESAASSSYQCTSRRAWRWATSRRRPRASLSWRTWPEGSAPLDRRPRRQSRAGIWHSIAATPRKRSPPYGRGSAPGAKSRPHTKPLRRGTAPTGPDRRRRRRRRAPRAQGRRPPGRRVRHRGRPRHPSRTVRGGSNHPHVPVLRHRGLDATVRGHGRRRVGTAAAVARPHVAGRVRAVERRGDQARRRRLLRRLPRRRRWHRCAAAIQRALARHRAEHGFAPSIRIGLHAGEATAHEGDYFGSAVTRAARIRGCRCRRGAGECRPHRGCRRGVPLSGERTLELKGIAEPVVAVLVTWDGERRISLALDVIGRGRP